MLATGASVSDVCFRVTWRNSTSTTLHRRRHGTSTARPRTGASRFSRPRRPSPSLSVQWRASPAGPGRAAAAAARALADQLGGWSVDAAPCNRCARRCAGSGCQAAAAAAAGLGRAGRRRHVQNDVYVYTRPSDASACVGLPGWPGYHAGVGTRSACGVT